MTTYLSHLCNIHWNHIYVDTYIAGLNLNPHLWLASYHTDNLHYSARSSSIHIKDFIRLHPLCCHSGPSKKTKDQVWGTELYIRCRNNTATSLEYCGQFKILLGHNIREMKFARSFRFTNLFNEKCQTYHCVKCANSAKDHPSNLTNISIQ